MSNISRTIWKAFEFILGSTGRQRSEILSVDEQEDAPVDHTRSCDRDFDADYRAALRLLRDRIDRKFPDGHYAKLRSGMNTRHDHGEDRAEAVNRMSTAVAMALRNGANVKEAAEAGAMSVGI